MPYEYKIVRRVEFSETDAAGIMHFSNYFRFMESAEHAFCRSLGFSVAHPAKGENLGLPRVHATCDYLAPLRFEDEVEVHLLVEKKSRRSITYQFHLKKLRPGPVRDVAKGRITVACVEHLPDATIKGVALPKIINEQIEVAPAALLSYTHHRQAQSTNEH